jgi:hypothetical protein
MPVGSIPMSDGRSGCIPPGDVNKPEFLTQPYDGAPAFRRSDAPSIDTTRFAFSDALVSDATSEGMKTTVPAHGPFRGARVGKNATWVDTFHSSDGLVRPGYHPAKKGVAAPWTYTGDSMRLADADMAGLRTQKGIAGQRERGDGRNDGRTEHAAGLVTHMKLMSVCPFRAFPFVKPPFCGPLVLDPAIQLKVPFLSHQHGEPTMASRSFETSARSNQTPYRAHGEGGLGTTRMGQSVGFAMRPVNHLGTGKWEGMVR